MCIICLVTITGCLNDPKPGEAWHTIDPFIRDLEAKNRFSGVVLVAQGDEVLFQEAYGWSNREEKLRNHMQTQFNLASMGKMFTAVAIGQLKDQEKLSLDDRISSYVTGLPEQAHMVTLRQLLSHTSGFGDTPANDMRTTEEYVDYIRKQPLLHEPGGSFYYSNSGYLLLGAVIEKVSGLTYQEYVVSEIFQPTGMEHTNFLLKEELPSSAVVGYEMKESTGNWQTTWDELPYSGRADGGVYSTASDLLKFWRAIEKNNLITVETRDEMIRQVTPLYTSKNFGYGYGFMVENWQKIGIVGHNGGSSGASTWTNYYPSTGLVRRKLY
jgi:D-alanyl-D-alanine carboxypeptidase